MSASIIFESGSTKFGATLDDIHQMTGSVLITGSISVKDLTPNNLSKFVVYDDLTGKFYYDTSGADGSSGTSGTSGSSGT